MKIERRRPRHPRFPVRVPAATAPVDAVWEARPAEARNLSSGGVMLQAADIVAAGTRVRVTLRLRKREPLTLVGKVTWSQQHPDIFGWAIGIEFEGEIPGEMVAEIAEEEHPPWVPRTF